MSRACTWAFPSCGRIRANTVSRENCQHQGRHHQDKSPRSMYKWKIHSQSWASYKTLSQIDIVHTWKRHVRRRWFVRVILHLALTQHGADSGDASQDGNARELTLEKRGDRPGCAQCVEPDPQLNLNSIASRRSFRISLSSTARCCSDCLAVGLGAEFKVRPIRVNSRGQGQQSLHDRTQSTRATHANMSITHLTIQSHY